MVYNLWILTTWFAFIVNYHLSNNITSEKQIQGFYSTKNNNLYGAAYGLCYIIILVTIIKVFMTGHLILFHVYLRWNNLTTYKYIMMQRKRKAEVMKAKIDKDKTSDLSLIMDKNVSLYNVFIKYRVNLD